mmetsp:Transcript_32419/g.82591  ORF Transcript_32419/g.82591 Transcript_32419/m.82591 type:complete len:204 (-) Transcript_32419:246-857(-)
MWVAPRQQRDEAAQDRAERRVEHGLEHLRVGLVPTIPGVDPLPDLAHLQGQMRVQGAEGSQDAGDDKEHRNILPVPEVLAGAPLVEHEGLQVRAAQVQQEVGEQGADQRARERSERELQGPADHRDFLKHVQHTTNRSVEDHGHCTCTADSPRNTLRMTQTLFVYNQHRIAPLALRSDVHPVPHIRHRHDAGHQKGNVAAHGH